MATLILSTVGTALGGPVGAAIGALIGQSIDQQILGPATRGPRLGDLTVQTSSYGTQVPRIYGRMRVAGSVIWSTDLSESTQTTGAKGQPDTTYSYSVSFAVALSSRPIVRVGRIWADGKLIRDADGAFTAPTTMRVLSGAEGQDVDPLIASIEGIALTPAYRGLALAVFENLELAAFGNRIPFLTFEVIADEADPSVGAILADASGGAIASTSAETLIGYAAYGASAGAAVMPLIDTFGLDLFDDGAVVRSSAVSAPVILSEADFGNSSDGERAARVQREQSPVRSVPAALRLSYYDPERDFQSGEARASAGDDGGSEQSSELPAVIGADVAKGIVHRRLARDWARREKVTLRLPPRLLSLEPATRVTVPLSPADWSVERCTIDGLVMVAEMRPVTGGNVALAAQAGRITGGGAVVSGPMTIALFDAPSLSGETTGTPQLLLAASSATPGWRGGAVDVEVAGQSLRFRAPVRKSVLGTALDTLGAGNSYLIDRLNTVEVALIDHDQWLTSCDDEALANGANLALIGHELIQFGDAVGTGEGRFRLGGLLRGRGGTEWAIGGHQSGEPFVLANPDQLSVLNLPAASVGGTALASPRSGAAETIVIGAEGLRPPPPVGVSAKIDASGALALSWIRRSRHGWTWRDEVDVPVGEAAERYGVRIVGPAGIVEASAVSPTIVIDAATLSAAGAGAATVEVRQIGDFAASRPATLSILLP